MADIDVELENNPVIIEPHWTTIPINEKETINHKEHQRDNFFHDGIRHTDYILVYNNISEKIAIRENFEKSLRNSGLELETDFMPTPEPPAPKHKRKFSRGNVTKIEQRPAGMNFVKVHAPWDVMCSWAQVTRIRKPIAKNDVLDAAEGGVSLCTNFGCCTRKLDSSNLTDKGYLFDTHDSDEIFFTAPFDKSRLSSYLGIDDRENFFTVPERINIVHNILRVMKCKEGRNGIERMIADEVFIDAYPPHEGPYQLPVINHKEKEERYFLNPRQTLYWTWARHNMWYKRQPLELIKRYFGEKIGIYFCWLGFYTEMLIPATVLGLIVFFYGIATVKTDEISEQICNSEIMICPLCDGCNFMPLNDSCFYSQITYVFDNMSTVAFAFFMSLWGSFFLEFWKRKRAGLIYKWETEDIHEVEGVIRPEFEKVAKETKLNPVTGEMEAYLTPKEKLRRITLSFATLGFMLLLVLAAVFGVVVYRTIFTVLAYRGLPTGIFKKNSRLIISVTASLINFIVITIMDVVYQKVAVRLTNSEAPRTQHEFEDSYTLKMFMFQAVNYYSSTVYAAFFKGRFSGSPAHYNRLFGYRLDECDPSGCLIEVCINLAVVMVLKQIINNTKELLVPVIGNWWKKRKAAKIEQQLDDVFENDGTPEGEDLMHNPVFRDYTLEAFGELGLFSEYLEMVIQYGFVTLFVAAFPLAPFFALFNNIIEIRLDAYKFITQFRRVPPSRAQDIGMWFSILTGISYFAVITNGLLIGITSNFIPQLVFLLNKSQCLIPGIHTHCLANFVNTTLISIQVQDIAISNRYNSSDPNVPDMCWYQQYQPIDDHVSTEDFWHVTAARFIFLFGFEHLIFFLKFGVDALIPDVPEELRIKSRRQRLLETRMFYGDAYGQEDAMSVHEQEIKLDGSDRITL